MARKLGTRLRITKREWYALGGFRNSALYRKHNGRHWTYWYLIA